MSAVSQISLMVMLEIDLSCSSFKRLSFKTMRVYFFRRSIFEFKDQRSFPAFSELSNIRERCVEY